MFAFTSPLDLEQILIRDFAGSIPIFIFLAFLILAILAARFRMPMIILLSLVALFIVFMSSTFLAGAFEPFYILVFILIAFGIGYIITRLSQR